MSEYRREGRERSRFRERGNNSSGNGQHEIIVKEERTEEGPLSAMTQEFSKRDTVGMKWPVVL